MAAAALLAGLTLAAAIAAIPPGHARKPAPQAEPAVPQPDEAVPDRPMLIGAASNFSQGRQDKVLEAALALPVRHFRDGIRWRLLEPQPGKYRFGKRRINYPAQLAKGDGDLVLTVNWGNPLFDGGKTPHSPQALAAFGAMAAAMVEQYPAITAVEVGNEFNSANFVNGPVRDAGIAERGAYHLAMVRAVAEAVREVRPDVRILGGATHSIAAGYLWPIVSEGGAELMDGLAIHPYTTPIDQLAAQIGVLRRNPAARSLDIEVTEFGTQDENLAPDTLVRAYASLASLGVSALYWYPLNVRGDDMVPLVDATGATTPTGKAFRFVQDRLATRVARDISRDRFTAMHRFGDDTLVLWGEPRRLTLLASDVTAHDATGRILDRNGLELAADRALVLTADRPIAPAADFALACSTLIADSFYQFSFPGEPARAAPGAGFAPYAASADGVRQDWVTRPGQQRGGVPWVPYLALAGGDDVRLTADSMRLAAGPASPTLVFAYRPKKDGPLRLEANFTPTGRGSAKTQVSVTSRGEDLFTDSIGERLAIDQLIEAEQGEPIELRLHNAGRGKGQRLDYRIRLHDPQRCTD